MKIMMRRRRRVEERQVCGFLFMFLTHIFEMTLYQESRVTKVNKVFKLKH